MSTVHAKLSRMFWPTFALAAMLAAGSLSAQAALSSYTSQGRNLVRMQSGTVDITLTADGNLLGSLMAGNASLVNDLVAASGGSLSAGDFDANGSTTWLGAKAVINYLNTTNYAGTNQWRLPTITDTGVPGCDFGFSGSDCGYNVAVGSGELARLYYNDLGRIAGFDTIGAPQSGYGIFANDGAQTTNGAVGPFTNVRSDAYWSGIEYVNDAGTAWLFGTSDGVQTFEPKAGKYFMWAVTPGEITPVPVPAALWLFAPALLGLVSRRRSPAATAGT